MNKFARTLRRNQTDTETKFWYFLRSRRFAGYKFRRQHPVGPYIVDFCCEEKRLIIELDGGQHATQVEKDETRTKYLRKMGYKTLRFWDHDVLSSTSVVLEVIFRELASTESAKLWISPHLFPSPLPLSPKERVRQERTPYPSPERRRVRQERNPYPSPEGRRVKSVRPAFSPGERMAKGRVEMITLCLCAFVPLCLSSLSAADWSNFKRDTALSGYATEQAYPPLSSLWNYQIQGEIKSQVAVSSNTVFLCGRDSSIHAFDAGTGQAVWDYSAEDWIDGSPAVYEGKVYAASRDGKLYTLDAVAGDLLWTYSMGSQSNSSPVIYNGIVYVACGFPGPKLMAVNAVTGQLVWSQTLSSYSDSSPAVSANGIVVVGANNGRFYAFDAVTGNPRGYYQTGGGIRFSSVAISSITAYAVAGDDDHNLYAFDISGSSITLRSGFPVALNTNPGAENVSSVAIAGNRLFVAIGVNPLALHCRNLADGSPVWQQNIGQAPPGIGYAPTPVVANDVVYAASGDGKIYMFKVLDGAQITAPFDLATTIVASPAIANGKVFISSLAGKLHGLNVSKVSAVSSPSDGLILGGTVTVKGIIINPDFVSYKVEYGAGTNPVAWTQIGITHTSLPAGEVLENWDTTSQMPGDYTLRLTVNDGSSNPPDSTALVRVRVDQIYQRVYVDAGLGANVASPDGTNLVIPPGAMNQNDFVTVDGPANYPVGGVPQGVTAAGIVRRFVFDSPDTVLTSPATLTLPYKASEISGLNVNQLWLYRYNGQAWAINETTTRDLSSNKLTTTARFPGYYRAGQVNDLAFQRLWVNAQTGAGISSLDGTALSIPPGAINQSDYVTVDSGADYSPGGVPQGVTATGIVRRFVFDNSNTLLLAFATLTLPYLPSEISGLAENQLWLFRYDGQYWVINETTTRDPVAKKLTTPVKFSGYFRVCSVTDPAFQRVWVNALNGEKIISLDGTLLDIPAKAMSQDDYVIIKVPVLLPSTSTITDVKPSTVKRHFAFENSSTVLLSSAILAVPYSASDIYGLGEEQLKLYLWQNNNWQKLDPAIKESGTQVRLRGPAPAPGYYWIMESLSVSAGGGGKYVSVEGLEIEVEPGALNQDDSFNVRKLLTGEFSDTMPGGISGINHAWELTMSKSDTVFLKPITVRFPYADADTAGLDESRLRIYWFDTQANNGAGAWRIVNNSQPDPAGNKVTAMLEHFTVFRVAAFMPSGPLLTGNGVYTYPNPAEGDVVTFKTLLGDDADIRIYVFNVAGEYIAELSNSGTGGNVIETVWDVSRIASGVYIYRVEAKGKTGGKSEIIKKLAIIH